MKKLLLFLVSLLGVSGFATTESAPAPLKSHVDERFELTSIVFRLAGAKEYAQCSVPQYAKDIDRAFASYKNHKIIPFIEGERNKYGVSYGDVAAAAGLLEIKNGKVSINPDIDVSKLKKEDLGRWTPEAFKTFALYLNDFYKKSNFQDFYNKHSDLYRLAEERLDKRLAIIDIKWFGSVFGEELEDPIIVASLTNGPSNYGGTFGAGKTKKVRIVVGSGSDNKGMPAYAPGFVSIILHEILHSFTNRLSDEYWPQIDSVATQKIYPHVREAMYRNAYASAKTTMLEWFNNLMVCLYFMEHPQIQKDTQISPAQLVASYQDRGFIWMDRSVQFMQDFIDNRDKYSTMDSFMPQVVEFVKHTAGHFDEVLYEFSIRKPYIVQVSPNLGETVTADTDTIFIRFSEPMRGDSGFTAMENKTILPLPVEKRWWKDGFTFVLVLKKDGLQKGKTYGAKFGFFHSKKGYVMDGGGGFSFIYTFKTTE